jgi:hypothetical protein
MTRTRSTHTVAELEVSAETFRELHHLLTQAGYEHAFIRDDSRILIDMTGIGVVERLAKAPQPGRQTFVLAGTPQQYRDYLAEHKVPHGVSGVRMIKDATQLHGFRDFDVVRVGTWQRLDPTLIREVWELEHMNGARR